MCLILLQVYCRRQGRPAEDVLLFEEGDAKHFITLTRTKDWRYVLINSTAKLSSEVSQRAASDDAHNNVDPTVSTSMCQSQASVNRV